MILNKIKYPYNLGLPTMQLAEQAGLPSLREYVVSQHIVLYAHSNSDVVLLAIKHQRQLVYASDT